jgi:hypothetical protein
LLLSPSHASSRTVASLSDHRTTPAATVAKRISTNYAFVGKHPLLTSSGILLERSLTVASWFGKERISTAISPHLRAWLI